VVDSEQDYLQALDEYKPDTFYATTPFPISIPPKPKDFRGKNLIFLHFNYSYLKRRICHQRLKQVQMIILKRSPESLPSADGECNRKIPFKSGA
jgi:hypothetical protein